MNSYVERSKYEDRRVVVILGSLYFNDIDNNPIGEDSI